MAEPWIRVHANLAGKPVIDRAMQQLGISSHEAMGLLVQFWGAVSQYVAGGQVGDRSDVMIEQWAGWKRKRGKFAAFIRESHLDADGRVNEWDEYAGRLEQRRATERDRLRNKRGGVAQQLTNNDATVRTMLAPARANDNANDTLRNDSPLAYATALAIRANQGLAEHPKRPQAIPRVIATNGTSHEAAEALIAERIPLAFAELQVYELAKSHKADDQVTSLNFFVGYVTRMWKRAKASTDANGSDRPKSNGNGRHAPSDPKARARVILELAKRYNLMRWVGDADDYRARQREAAADPRAGAGFLEEVEPLKLHVGIGDMDNEQFAIAEIAKRMQSAGVAP